MSNFTLQRQHRSAQYFKQPLERNVDLEMVLIPGGSFLMGSPDDEIDRRSNEGPQHPVTVPPFFMGRYPVTQAQWKVVATWPQINCELKANLSHFQGDRRPVERVFWHDAVEFCDRLSAHTGREYRLPTEAEWEYACRASPIQTSGTPGSGEVRRAGTTTPFHFGETITTDLANYRGTDAADGSWSGSYGRGPKGIFRQATTPVGSFPANAFGLCDMHGNVWEWCLDHWHGNYKGAPVDGSAWTDNGAKADAVRVKRGGSWINAPRLCRSACRSSSYPGNRLNFNGFRVVCVPPRTL